MAIYTNEHLTDLLNEQHERVRELEKANARLDEENHKLTYSLSQSVPVESSLEQYDRIKELEEIINSEELLRQHMNSVGYRELCKLKEELQKSQNEIESLRAVYKRNIDSLSTGLSEDLLKTLRTYPTALPYICELKQELQATKEQLDTVVKYLKISYQWGLYLYESENFQEMEDEDEKENMKDDLDIVHSFLNKQKDKVKYD